MAFNNIVSMKNITMSFSGNVVLKNVDFTLREGEIHSLMGANGAGKSTLIKILNGIHRPVSGEIEVAGVKATIKEPKDAEKYGLAFVHQELNICNDMSVAENMYIGNWALDRYGFYDKGTTEKNAKGLLDVMGIDLDPTTKVKYLRTAEKQVIEILKTLTRDTKVIILDEPTSSLNEKEKEKFFEIVYRLKSEGVSIIFISHFLEDVMELSDRITVLKDGIINGVFDKEETSKEELVTAMIGRQVQNSSAAPIEVAEDAEIALELINFTSERKFEDVNLKVQKGDIVGVCGLLGAGKTELARAIFGLDDYKEGEIHLFGEHIAKPDPYSMIKKKVALLTEERKLEGFIPLLSIRENATLSIMRRFKSGFEIDEAKRKSFTADLIDRMAVKMSSIEQEAVYLSGGNQQKVVITKCLANEPKVFLLDEPTRGVDVYAKNEIYGILREAAENGTTILIFSSELEELLSNCSKIIVLKKGRIDRVVNAAETSKNELLSLIG